MEIPTEITKALHEKEIAKGEERKREHKEKLREKQKEKNHAGIEKKLFPEKVELCRNILRWAEEFRQTKEWQKLSRKRSVYGVYDVQAVTVGGWTCDPKTGKKQPRWPILSFDIIENGVAHEERWCWMGYTYDRFDEPTKMAKKLHYAYLQLVWEHLERGKVWERLVWYIKNDE